MRANESYSIAPIISIVPIVLIVPIVPIAPIIQTKKVGAPRRVHPILK